MIAVIQDMLLNFHSRNFEFPDVIVIIPKFYAIKAIKTFFLREKMSPSPILPFCMKILGAG
jgi:hypothetical protein